MMPNHDRTGPKGAGPRTGRAMGLCRPGAGTSNGSPRRRRNRCRVRGGAAMSPMESERTWRPDGDAGEKIPGADSPSHHEET